jgi:Tol biopolymer transport system component
VAIEGPEAPDGAQEWSEFPEPARVNVDGSGIVTLTRGALVEDREPSWSSDGSQLAIISKRGGNDEVYRINDDATGPLRLTMSDFFSEGSAVWSPCR